jgi:hypothetical protein
MEHKSAFLNTPGTENCGTPHRRLRLGRSRSIALSALRRLILRRWLLLLFWNQAEKFHRCSWAVLGVQAQTNDTTTVDSGNGSSDNDDLIWSYLNETCFLSVATSDDPKQYNHGLSSSSHSKIASVVPGCWGRSYLDVRLQLGHPYQYGDDYNGYGEGEDRISTVAGLFGTIRTVYTGANYTLALTVQVDLDELLHEAERGIQGGDYSTLALQEPGVFTGSIRLIFCNALQIGACNIFHGSSNTNENGSGDDDAFPSVFNNRSGAVNGLYDASNGTDRVGSGVQRNQNQSLNGDAGDTELALAAGDRDQGFLASQWLDINLYPTN